MIGTTEAVKTRRFFVSFLRLTRVWNLVIIALSQYMIAAVLVGNHTLSDLRLFLLSASTLMIAAGGYVINDYYDVKIDLVNKPERVVIGRGITRRYAILFHTILSVAGVAAGVYLNWRLGVINFASAFLLWWYSNDLKRHPFIGNLVVALLSGIAIMIVDGLYRTGNLLILSYATFGFFMTLIREVIKDMEDLKGDDTFGCRTLPIVWGLRKTKIFLYGLIALFAAIAVGLNAWLIHLPNYVLLFLVIPLAYMAFRLFKADTKKDFEWLSIFCKVLMLLGLFSLLLL
jgi:4-hydroxybenzoate polyprenyltransferase